MCGATTHCPGLRIDIGSVFVVNSGSWANRCIGLLAFSVFCVPPESVPLVPAESALLESVLPLCQMLRIGRRLVKYQVTFSTGSVTRSALVDSLTYGVKKRKGSVAVSEGK